MLAAERKQLILERLRLNGKIIAGELSAELDISEDTLRRDLRELAEAGLLRKVHGGALPVSPAAQAGYADRQMQSPQAKVEIARAALGLLRPGQVVIFDGGTTTLQVAQQLPPEMRLTVITNSPPVAVALAGHPAAEVYLLGGRLIKRNLVACSPETVEAITQIRADVCLLGVCSIHPEVGLSIPESDEVYVKRAMINSSAETVALASAEKLGTVSTFVVAPIGALTTIITEAGASSDILEPYRRQGIAIVTANS
jgi:DeoR/GlpR family transcriptional regulator of sugar metabolism